MTESELLEQNPRLADLLVAQVTTGLDPEEERELDELLHDHPTIDRDVLLRAAAMLDIAFMSKDDQVELPRELRDKVLANFEGAGHRPRVARIDSLPDRPSRSGRFGWGIAAAAMIALALNLYQAFLPEVSPSVARAELMKEPGIVTWEWVQTTDRFSSVRGDVVWSPSDQRGFLKFSGLPRLDPSREQYQLWIVDRATRRKHPVDGGLFDYADSKEVVIVPFEAKLPVFEASAFAITVETPGGVVVSDGPLEIVAARPD